MIQSTSEYRIKARLKYLLPSDKKPIYYASEGGQEARLDMDGDFETRIVDIHNGRYQDEVPIDGGVFSLDREGFTLNTSKSRISDFYCEQDIKEHYLPETESLIGRIVGSDHVVAFDYTLRADKPALRKEKKSREPSTVVHNDYTSRSAPQRVRDILGNPAANTLIEKRFMIVNLWRPIRNPVMTSPLAVCDAQSVKPANLVAVERHAKDRIGEIFLATYDPDHQWYYFNGMLPDEALLIKTFDSEDTALAKSCIHTAFTAPDTPEDAPARESIEVRAFVFF